MTDERAWRPWRAAMHDALYGPAGFYHRTEGGPGHHYRTSSSASPLFARALAWLVREVDGSLGSPERLDVVEIAAARGGLLTAVGYALEALDAGLASRVRLTAVELADRPQAVPDTIAWLRSLDEAPPVRGVLIANEWLDNVPCDVVEQQDGQRLVVEVSPDGDERLTGPVSEPDAAWLDRWWPGLEDGDRAEVGGTRDTAWAGAVRHLAAGVAIAVDYGHTLEDRLAGAYPAGTLTGYRDGRAVLPVPDGTCDVTAHVAMDACAAAGAAAGMEATRLTTQREALLALGLTAGTPPVELATSDPVAYLEALRETSSASELLARGGLGDFLWLVQAVGVPLPALASP